MSLLTKLAGVKAEYDKVAQAVADGLTFLLTLPFLVTALRRLRDGKR